MAASTLEVALSAQGLKKYYGELKAVDDISLTVNHGSCVALLGPNGAGKTTTVEMLEGLLPPDSGEVQILGQSLTKNRRQILERIGVVLQETTLYKRYTVTETVALFASFYKNSLAPEVVINRLHLTDKKDTQLRHLSGGQRQRVYLACALVNDPQLLFLDEPTTGLDPQARRAIWDLVGELKKEGRSILLTTHYMDEAEALADHVLIIDHGKVIAEGTPQQLIRDTCGDTVQQIRHGTLEDVFIKLTGRSIRES
ncbi:MAG: ABC transporter ATP-binding protein [Deltaproteobacteria bacterium]|nr:ABC transporter ATP-binding protein [Deltaproteobacteria bacterium]